MTGRDRFHGEMCRFVEGEGFYKLLLEPRGSLKSSCITIGYPLQRIVKDPNIRILIASEEFNTSKKFLAEIKGHVEHNATFQKLYGNLKSDEKWSESEIIVKTRTRWRKEPTITCAGIDVTKVGLHYDLIIIDDPHSTKNITTREQLDKVLTWYKLVLSLLDPGGKLIIIGTRWHYDDLSGWIIERERERYENGKPKRYDILQKTAVRGKLNEATPDSRLLWPERLSKEFLIDQRLDQGPYIFSCQYRNRPVDDESAIFKRSWVQFYKEEDLPKNLINFTVMDPARDEEGKDYTAIITVSVDNEWNCYLREVRRGKWNEWDVLDQLIRCYKRWHFRKGGVESVAWQKTYYRFFKQEIARQNLRIPITELKTDTRITKAMRIRSMVPYWKSGLYRVPGTSIPLLKGNMGTLVDELLRYPKVSSDDCVDALAYVDQLIKRPLISIIKKRIPRGSFKAIKQKMRKPASDKLGVFNVI